MPKIDIDAVKSARTIDDVIGQFIELKPNGREFEALCPFHNEKTPSFRVIPDKDMFYCFGCGAHGDAIDFVTEHTGAEFREACEVIAGNLDIKAADVPKREIQRVDIYERYSPVAMNPDTLLPVVGREVKAVNPKRDHKTSKFTPSHVWPYRAADGSVVAIVIRFDIDGKKITPCLRWCKWDRGEGWVMHPMPDEGRPLMNLPELLANASRQVVVVEGEKAAESLQRVVGDSLTVVAWSGGTNAVRKTDWAPMAGRSVIVIPDNDQPGFDAANEVAGELMAVGAASIKMVMPESERPKGWDVADHDWHDVAEFVGWAKRNITEPQSVAEPDPFEDDECTMADQDAYLNSAPDEPPEEPRQREYGLPFQILGYNDDWFYFLPTRSRQVKQLTASSLGAPAQMLALAPLDVWQNMAGLSPDEKIKSEHWLMNANGLIERCYMAGVFDVSRIRGRGAWIDAGRNVLHVGDKLYVDGIESAPDAIDSRYIYPQALPMAVEYVNPASNQQAHEFYQVCQKLSWEQDLSGTLLAGWCVIAPICGMLDWRPHIWITGASGAGKSTVLNDIIRVMLGNVGVCVEGKTTEAGIRQRLGNDARPILFDEAEAEDEASAKRMQSILDFARVSSSGGTITKGSAGGKAIEFSARSAFCFSSINTTVKHLADEARITKLVLRKDHTRGIEYWDQLARDIEALITPEYANAMISRSIANMAIIKQNIDVFIRAANRVFKSRRIADQIGTVLAGAYLCHSTSVIDTEQAEKWILRHDWADHTIVNAKPDPERLVERIATRRVVLADGRGGRFEMTIGEVILIAVGRGTNPDHYHLTEQAKAELRRFGIKAAGDRVIFANACNPLADLLRGTPWESSWARTLSEIDGAEKEANQYFAPGIKCRGVSLSVSIFAE